MAKGPRLAGLCVFFLLVSLSLVNSEKAHVAIKINKENNQNNYNHNNNNNNNNNNHHNVDLDSPSSFAGRPSPPPSTSNSHSSSNHNNNNNNNHLIASRPPNPPGVDDSSPLLVLKDHCFYGQTATCLFIICPFKNITEYCSSSPPSLSIDFSLNTINSNAIGLGSFNERSITGVWDRMDLTESFSSSSSGLSFSESNSDNNSPHHLIFSRGLFTDGSPCSHHPPVVTSTEASGSSHSTESPSTSTGSSVNTEPPLSSVSSRIHKKTFLLFRCQTSAINLNNNPNNNNLHGNSDNTANSNDNINNQSPNENIIGSSYVGEIIQSNSCEYTINFYTPAACTSNHIQALKLFDDNLQTKSQQCIRTLLTRLSSNSNYEPASITACNPFLSQ